MQYLPAIFYSFEHHLKGHFLHFFVVHPQLAVTAGTFLSVVFKDLTVHFTVVLLLLLLLLYLPSSLSEKNQHTGNTAYLS